MAIVTNRVARSIRDNPTLPMDAVKVYDELEKLIRYYINEIKINQSDLKRTDDVRQRAYLKGLCEAYHDQVAEISYIQEMLRGGHHDNEGFAQGRGNKKN
jgi:hypothetical protein